eukprot:CAMPEP_0170435674 /NCGR_PEP_ID=MMETSP0117_2-20130122/43729_1 /TAXON_ID=400756 /ORGANISM="Durinskia baltica, Strain CSIRO CS-38" /LENGTH=39 /DNA_ID= /DNA_START= /DNA_END= /DNA_ORIENTATION=
MEPKSCFFRSADMMPAAPSPNDLHPPVPLPQARPPPPSP